MSIVGSTIFNFGRKILNSESKIVRCQYETKQPALEIKIEENDASWNNTKQIKVPIMPEKYTQNNSSIRESNPINETIENAAKIGLETMVGYGLGRVVGQYF